MTEPLFQRLTAQRLAAEPHGLPPAPEHKTQGDRRAKLSFTFGDLDMLVAALRVERGYQQPRVEPELEVLLACLTAARDNLDR